PIALSRLRRGLDRLSDRARRLVVLENDDRVYTVQDLLPLCEADDIRLVYDVHHHRCLPDGLTITEATEAAAATWKGAEPWVHLSSPAEGWRASDPRPHHDLIATRDFPEVWRHRRITIDVEAKAKEKAVLALARSLSRKPGGRGYQTSTESMVRTTTPGRVASAAKSSSKELVVGGNESGPLATSRR
ncbi:MAG TPA: UV DNA damage repair endonuclease UvsE, partial [Polyangia bacterium]